MFAEKALSVERQALSTRVETSGENTHKEASSPSSLTLNAQRSLVIVSRTLADVAPRVEEVVSDADRLLAACAGLFDPGAAAAPEADKNLRAALTLMQACLRDENSRIVAQRVIASRGLPRLPRLEEPELRRAFAASRAVFSVSELESYGRCPFQYFLRHVLSLRPEEEGIHARTQGTLLHSVLHKYFQKRNQKPRKNDDENDTKSDINNKTQVNKAVNDDTADEMRLALQEILAQLLEAEDLDGGPHQKRMLHRLLSDALDGFVQREQQFGPQWGLTPTHFELAFGFGQRAAWEDEESVTGLPLNAAEDEHRNGYDPASCAEPLQLHITDGGAPVAICGTLDRVDVDVTGRRALVMDYKLGKPPEHSAIQRGRQPANAAVSAGGRARVQQSGLRSPATTACASAGGGASIAPNTSISGSSCLCFPWKTARA